VQIIGGILVLVAAAAGIVGYFKANVSKSTIELYKEDNEALRTRLSTLEQESVKDKIEIAALKTAQAHLVAIITQAEQIAAIREQLNKIAVKVGAV